MQIGDQFSLHYGFEQIDGVKGLISEITEIISDPTLLFGLNSSKEIKTRISDRFNEFGWADKVRIGKSNLTISFLKSKIGVCFQIGNVARTYADILKLCQLKKRGIIDAGIILVPEKEESKKMGANYAQFDRLAGELAHFEDILDAPILVIGLKN